MKSRRILGTGSRPWRLMLRGLTLLTIGSVLTAVSAAQSRTTDWGESWMLQSSGTTYWLTAVSFTDANTATAVGLFGTILRTTDGGARWTLQSSGTTNSLYGVSFTDGNTGTVVGAVGTILRTTDGRRGGSFAVAQ